MIHVKVTALNPDVNYTTLPVNMNTTAHEVVFTVMEKHDQSSCYSAKEFYLAEVSTIAVIFIHTMAIKLDMYLHLPTVLYIPIQTSQIHYIV